MGFEKNESELFKSMQQSFAVRCENLEWKGGKTEKHR